MPRLRELLAARDRPMDVFLNLVVELWVIFFQEFLVNIGAVLRLGVMYLADEFPDFASHLLALDLVQPFQETLINASMGYMVNLKLKLCWDGIVFPYTEGQDNDPFFSAKEPCL